MMSTAQQEWNFPNKLLCENFSLRSHNLSWELSTYYGGSDGGGVGRGEGADQLQCWPNCVETLSLSQCHPEVREQ